MKTCVTRGVILTASPQGYAGGKPIRNALLAGSLLLAGTGSIVAVSARPVTGVESESRRASLTSTRASAYLPSSPRRSFSPKDAIERIRLFSKLSMSDIAALLGVTRQAVYNWVDGGAITGAHQDALLYLTELITTCHEMGLELDGTKFRRPVLTGMNFFEAVKVGNRISEVAPVFIRMLEREKRQKTALQTFLNSQPKRSERSTRLLKPTFDQDA